MTNNNSYKPSERPRLSRPFLLVIILILGVFPVWWFASSIDKNMRSELIINTKQIAASINIERIKTLTGTEADLNSSDYLRRKEMLATVRSANPKCRFVYLMGQRDDGTIFFFADSEPSGSQDESPAGQIYEDASPELRQVFDKQISITEGPVTDNWGVWISALTPLLDPKTGKLVAVLGLDYDAHTWRWDVATQTALPAGLILMLLFMTYLLVVLRERTTAMLHNEQKYEYLFEGAAGGIAIIRGEKIEFANPALSRITGHPSRKLLSVPFITLIHPEDQKMVLDNYSRRMKGQQIETDYDFRVIADDGSVIWVNINAQMINWDGNPANLCFFTNITDRKHSEEKLAALYEETIRMNRLMQGREDRLIELKKEVNKLSLELNQKIIYKSVEDEG
jgi:PAS domain S-box-containing protein